MCPSAPGLNPSALWGADGEQHDGLFDSIQWQRFDYFYLCARNCWLVLNQETTSGGSKATWKTILYSNMGDCIACVL